MTESQREAAPNPIHAADVAVLIGMLAYLEGELLAGLSPGYRNDKIRELFVGRQLLKQGDTDEDLRDAIHALNQRLRYVLGEYPKPLDGPPSPSSD